MSFGRAPGGAFAALDRRPLCSTHIQHLSMAPAHNLRFLEIAEALKPVLKSTPAPPLRVISVEADESELLGWRAVDAGALQDIKSLDDGQSVILDFGARACGAETRQRALTLGPHRRPPCGILLV